MNTKNDELGLKLIRDGTLVQELSPVREAQVISYLEAAEMKRGLLINFNVTSLKSGMRRYSV